MSDRIGFTSGTGALVLAISVVLAACSSGAEETPGVSSEDTTTTTGASSTASSDLTGGSSSVTVEGREITYQAAHLVDAVAVTVDGGTFESDIADENVFLVINGGTLTLNDATVIKSGDASSSDSQRTADVSDAYNFYGLNSAIVVIGEGSSATIDGTTITISSEGSNAVVAVDGGSADVTNVSIATTGNSSRGLHATYGGTITGVDVTIDTEGAHCAAVATDRGGGTVTVTGTNSFHTAGDGSPLVYSTGSITVSGVTGTADISEVVVVEGKNTATILDSDVTSAGGHASMIYQSMSGDAADSDAAASVGSVTLENSTLAFTGTEAVLYFTNASAELTLVNVVLDTPSSLLASAQEDRWGTSGSNGADVTLTVSGSSLVGDVEAGPTSSIDVVTIDGGTVTGSMSGSVTITAR